MKELIINTYQQNKKTFIKYLLVGVLNTVVGYGLYGFLLYIKMYYLLALTISHIIATTNSYFWNKHFTFKSKGNVKNEIIRFVSVYTLIYFINLPLLFIFVNVFGFKPFISQFMLIGIITLVSFIGQRFFTFRKSFQTTK